MKIEVNDDKIILYLREVFFKDNIKDITIQIKKIFLKLMNYYHCELSGLYDVIVYENNKYGTILEIIKKDNLFHPDIIDIKVKLFKNKKIYLRTKDYFIFKTYSHVYYDQEYYYINIENIYNINKVIEFVDVIYNEKDNYLTRKKSLK